jgi:hypothetical protein
MVVPDKLNVKNMISICIQCVCNVYLKSYQALEANTSQISTKQWTIKVVPDQLNVKTMILICIQCVFNVFSMCIQCVFNVYSRSYQSLEADNCPISIDYNGSAN